MQIVDVAKPAAGFPLQLHDHLLGEHMRDRYRRGMVVDRFARLGLAADHPLRAGDIDQPGIGDQPDPGADFRRCLYQAADCRHPSADGEDHHDVVPSDVDHRLAERLAIPRQ